MKFTLRSKYFASFLCKVTKKSGVAVLGGREGLESGAKWCIIIEKSG